MPLMSAVSILEQYRFYGAYQESINFPSSKGFFCPKFNLNFLQATDYGIYFFCIDILASMAPKSLPIG